MLRARPEIAGTAVEELLRFDAPLQWLSRVTTCDVLLHGRTIPQGSRVLLIWAAANRDERRWSSPDELILLRDRLRNIAFGEGIHHCLGAPLARLEARIVLEELMPPVAEYELDGG